MTPQPTDTPKSDTAVQPPAKQSEAPAPFRISFYEELLLNLGFNIIKAAVRNPAHASALKTQLLEIRDAISNAYPGE